MGGGVGEPHGAAIQWRLPLNSMRMGAHLLVV